MQSGDSFSRSSSQSIVLTRTRGIAFGPTFQRLQQQIPFSQALISTTLPRGGLQVIQPRQADPGWIRAYSREHHLLDVLAWQALSRCTGQRLSHLNGEGILRTAERFRGAALAPINCEHYAVIPLRPPLLEGYPGVLQLFRRAGEGDFNHEEMLRLAGFADELADAIEDVRRRRCEDECRPHALAHDLPIRQMVVLPGRRYVYPSPSPAGMDPALAQNLLEAIDSRLSCFCHRPDAGCSSGTAGDGPLESIPETRAGALTAPSERGEQWKFRLVLYEFFPALTGGDAGPVAILSLPPECDTWAQLQASDIEADSELARLVPALQYMHRHFASGVNLTEVARSVHLSAFHFHRRFTELLGTTPKHFLFDCQISSAKRHLAQNEKSLSEIAAETGFAHQSHFTSRFRQATGLTPTQWKRLAASTADAAGVS